MNKIRLEPTKILLVDDRPENLKAMAGIISGLDLDVTLFEARSGLDGLALTLNHDFALVILDVQMPEMDGFEMAELMRGRERSRHIPIIFVTAGATDTFQVFKGYEAGAVDFLSKPFDPHALSSKVRVFVELDRSKCQLKEQLTASRAAEERFRLLMENVKDHAIFMLDTEGHFIDWNAGAERLTGYSERDMVGQSFALIFTEEDCAAGVPEKELAKAAADGQANDVRWHQRKDGQRFWAEGCTTALRTESGELRGFAKVARDSTAGKLAADSLHESNERLRQREGELEFARDAAETASRAKSEFLANMSHEIRTPLGAIIGFAELLTEEGIEENEKPHFIETIIRNGNELTGLIDDILDLSKVEAGHLTVEECRISLPDLIGDVTTSLSVKAREKAISLSVESSGTVPEIITTDPTRLRQILLNVIGNAIKFTERGGVKMIIKIMDGKNPGTSQLAFVVEDSGCGMTPEDQQKLFMPFTQADTTTTRKFGGTGLGLALSRALALALGGDVQIESSAPGVGSVFIITIDAGPIETGIRTTDLPECVKKPLHQQPSHAMPRLSGVHVLLADDSPDNRLLITRILTKYGAEVDVALDGVEAVERALDEHYDVVLMDIQMPLLDGYAATSQLRKQGYIKPIVALTAHAMREEREKCLRAGCSDHLTKPIDMKHLVETVSRHSKPRDSGYAARLS